VTTQPRSGEGTIGWWTGLAMTVTFVTIIIWPVGWQTTDRLVPAMISPFPDDMKEMGFYGACKALESRLEHRGYIQELVRLPYRTFLFETLQKASDRTALGNSGFLYYRDDVQFQWEPGPMSRRQEARIAEARDVRNDAFEEAVQYVYRRLTNQPAPKPPSPPPYVNPRTMILDTVRQFNARGIPVLVVPLPGKLAIYPECYEASYPLGAGPAVNRDFPRLGESLKAEGVTVVDVIQAMWDAKARTNELLFLKMDSHWSPTGLAVAADTIAEAAKKIIGRASNSPFSTETVKLGPDPDDPIPHRPVPSDQRALLDLRNTLKYFPAETAAVTRVLNTKGYDRDGDGAPVLLLGDSYTTFYQDHNGGLPEQLMLRLGCGVESIAHPGATPAALLHMLSDRPAALARKKLVIWTFVDRHVNKVGEWELVPLPPP
jgi:hypothetical protein